MQPDEAERISGESADASDAEGAAKDATPRVPEEEDTASGGAGEQTMSKVEQEAPPANVRTCQYVHSKTTRTVTAFDEFSFINVTSNGGIIPCRC